MNKSSRRDKESRRAFPRFSTKKKASRSAETSVTRGDGTSMDGESIHSSATSAGDVCLETSTSPPLAEQSYDLNLSPSHVKEEEDPVTMMLQLKKMRTERLVGIQKGVTEASRSVVDGTHRMAKSVTSTAPKHLGKSVVKSSQKVVRGTQKVSRGTKRTVVALTARAGGKHLISPANNNNTASTTDYDEEEAVTETNPLLHKDEPPSRGSALWARLREHRDTVVFAPQSTHDEEEKSHHRKEIENEIRSGLEFSMTQCLLAIVLYLTIAVLAYSVVLEQWSVIDSLYFATVTFTTIGYGDLVPSSDLSRIFTACFALTGVACLGIALGVLGSNLIDAQNKAMDSAKELTQYQVMSLFDSTPSQESTESIQDRSAKHHHQESSWHSSRWIRSILPLFVLLLICFWFLGSNSEWDVPSTFYYCIITAATVGYGDLTPTSQSERLFAVPMILLAVGAMGQWLSLAANAIIERRQSKFHWTELTIQDLEVMDDDGDGRVSLAEFLKFMLTAMNKVEAELIADLEQQFHRLDVDGTGSLERQDLIIVAKKKLKSAKRKLQLSQYKQQLLRVSRTKFGNNKDGPSALATTGSQ